MQRGTHERRDATLTAALAVMSANSPHLWRLRVGMVFAFRHIGFETKKL
jgi:hypothetical protein